MNADDPKQKGPCRLRYWKHDGAEVHRAEFPAADPFAVLAKVFERMAEPLDAKEVARRDAAFRKIMRDRVDEAKLTKDNGGHNPLPRAAPPLEQGDSENTAGGRPGTSKPPLIDVSPLPSPGGALPAEEREGRVLHSTAVTTSSAGSLFSVRDTSMVAYRALQWSGRLAAQERLIVDHLMAHPGQTFTRQELARDLKIGINAVCGRVTALIDAPFCILIENGKKTCSVTKNTVNALELAIDHQGRGDAPTASGSATEDRRPANEQRPPDGRVASRREALR